MMLNVTRSILTRLRKPAQRKFDRAASLTIAVTADTDADALVSEIVAEIARFGTAKHLSSDRVDRTLNRTSLSQITTNNVGVPRLAEFMHEADVGDLHHDRRFQSCREDARRAAPDHGGSSTRHSCARSEVADRRRGHGYGLVFSGGGARGFAHLGALRALREQGVPIDQVAGCSMGAVLAATIALDHDDDTLWEVVQRQSRRLRDCTLPIVSLLKGGRISRSIEHTFGSWDIEDLWLPFYCVSTNLTTSQLEVHRRGSAAIAIRASVAIPGVLPPVPCDGDLLVDGGVMNNFPFEMMRDNSTVATIIAMDVARDQGPAAAADYGMSVSGFQALISSFRRGESVYPSAPSVLRSLLAGAIQNQNASLADGSLDLLLTLRLPGFGLLDFERSRVIADTGYEASKSEVRTWAATRPVRSDERKPRMWCVRSSAAEPVRR